MKVRDVLNILQLLSEQKETDAEAKDLAYLKDKKLIQRLSDAKYSEMKSKIRSIEKVRFDIAYFEKSIKKLEAKVKSLKRKVKPFWLLSPFKKLFTSEFERQKLAYDLKTAKARVESNETKMHELKIREKELKNLSSTLNTYTSAGKGYARITQAGLDMIETLKVRMPRIAETELEEAEAEIAAIKNAIDKRHKRFLEMLDYLEANDYDSSDKRVVSFALSLSGLEGSIHQIYERACVVDSYLYEQDWDSYDRLKSVFSLVSQPGNIRALIDEFDQIFDMMIENGHGACFATLSEAAGITKIEALIPREKYNRFEALREALDKRAWDASSALTNYLAYNLARRTGKPDEIAEKFRNRELALVNEGASDCHESGMAALILFDNPETDEKVAREFMKALERMA